tara:strand:- start:1666 stop:1875 length:210 start_codon:yes stop_codon:yes gene_type:complete
MSELNEAGHYTEWTIDQAFALNKMLDLVHDLLDRVEDKHLKARYERRHQLILDAMFPERLRTPHLNKKP